MRLSILLLVLLSLAAIAPARGDSPATVPVRTAKVTSGSAAWGKAFVGSVQPARRSVVGTAVAGRINEVFAEPGDLVKNNALLAQLRLTAIKIQLASANADLEASQQRLAEFVAGPRQEDLRRLEAVAKSAQAKQVNAQKRFDRLQSLSRQGASARGELDDALSTRDSAEQDLIAAKAAHDAAVVGTRPEQLAQAKAAVAKMEEEVNRIQDFLDEHTIRTPFAGYVVKRLAEKGEWVGVGDPVAEVIELNPAEVRVAVPEDHIASLRRGQEVRVVVDALVKKGDKRRDLAGEIFRIVPDADARSRSFPVRVRIDNPLEDGMPTLRPGMLARVFLPVGKEEEVLLVSQDALVLDRSRTYVFVVEEVDGIPTANRMEVETGPTKSRLIQIKPRGRSTLAAGAEVVVEGNERLSSGQAVERIQ